MKDFLTKMVKKKQFFLFMIFVLAVGGLISSIKIAKEQYPDVTIPVIRVSGSLAGLSAEDADNLVVLPILRELSGTTDMKKSKGFAKRGMARVAVEFKQNADMEKAKIDVQDAVDRAERYFPEDIVTSVNEIKTSDFPVITLSVINKSGDLRQLYGIADSLKTKIEGVAGVSQVDLLGERDPVVKLTFLPEEIANYGLTLTEITNLFRTNNRMVTSGTLDTGTGSFSMVVPGTIKNIDDLMNFPIKKVGKEVLKIKNIGHVQWDYSDEKSLARLNGKSAIAMNITNSKGSNLLETVDNVKHVVNEFKQTVPEGVDFVYSGDTSKDVRESFYELVNSVIFTSLLVMVVIVLILGVRSGILVGVIVPLSFLMTLIVLFITGFTLNVVLLIALILSVGLLVDSGVIVVEYAEREMMQGASPREAYVTAANRMMSPILTSTATTIVVFMPLFFWPGIPGKFMLYFPLAIPITLLASFIVAVLFIPVLGSLRKDKITRGNDPDSINPEILMKAKSLMGRYTRFIYWGLNHRFFIISSTVGGFIGICIIYAFFNKGTILFPSTDPSAIRVSINVAGNLSLGERNKIVSEVESRLQGVQDVKNVFTSVRKGSTSRGDNIGAVSLEYVDWQKRTRVMADTRADIERRLEGLNGIGIVISSQEMGPPKSGGGDIVLNIKGNSPFLLEAARKVEENFEHSEFLKDVNADLVSAESEILYSVDRENIAKYGLSMDEIASWLRLYTSEGVKVAEFNHASSDKPIDIIAQVPLVRRHYTEVQNVKIRSALGDVSLNKFIQPTMARKPPPIRRENTLRSYSITANIKDSNISPSMAMNKIAEELNKEKFPDGVSWSFGGDSEDIADTISFLISAFLIAFLCMFLILLMEISSFYLVGVIFTAIAFAFSGVFVGLMIAREPFSVVMCGLAVMALMGTVVNNNIVLVDAFCNLRRQGQSPLEAAFHAVLMRVRPVLLTSSTTILGLIPLAAKISIDFLGRDIAYNSPSSQMWVQLGTAFAGGMALSTVITLVFTPCMLSFYKREISW